MAQNGTTWRWDGQRTKAAELVASGRWSQEQIAAKVLIGRRTLARWLDTPQFAEKVEQLVAAQDREAMKSAIAKKSQRVAVLNELVQDLLRLKDERAADPQMAAVAGGTTGLLVRSLKMIGAGERAQVVAEFELDGTLLREVREYQQQAAKELGEFPGAAEAEGAPPIVLSQVVVATREDARLYMERVYAQPGALVGVVTQPPPAPTPPALPSSFKDALAQAEGPDAAGQYQGPDGL
jgi:hypothetical protein